MEERKRKKQRKRKMRHEREGIKRNTQEIKRGDINGEGKGRVWKKGRCAVILVQINRVRLPILLVVS